MIAWCKQWWRYVIIGMMALLITISDIYGLMTEGLHPEYYWPFVYPCVFIGFMFMMRAIDRRTQARNSQTRPPIQTGGPINR